MLTYKPAFEVAELSGKKIYKIVTGSAYTAMRSDGYITTRSLDKLCAALNCQPGDLVRYIAD